MKLTFGSSPASVILRVMLRHATTNVGLTGLSSASAGLIISTIKIGEATATTYTVAGSTIETIATLGTFAAPTATKCRFKEVDATNHKGLYEIQFDDARFSATNLMQFSITGATNLLDFNDEVQLNLLADGTAAVAGIKQLTISNSAGDALVLTASGGNGNGLNATGNGSGNGIKATGGTTAGAAGMLLAGGATNATNGLLITGGSTSGDGMKVTATSGNAIVATAGTAGAGISATGVGTGGHGILATSGTTAATAGICAQGGATNATNGMLIKGGSTSGVGLVISATSGGGATITAASAGAGLVVTGVGTAGDGIRCVSGTTASTAGFAAVGGATNATFGMRIAGGSTSGTALQITATSGVGINVAAGTNGAAAVFTGIGTGGDGIRAVSGTTAGTAGIAAVGGATNATIGMLIKGGSTSGDGLSISATSGNGITVAGGTAGHGISTTGAGAGNGIISTGGNSATTAGILAVGGAAGAHGIRATGNTTGAGLSVTGGATGAGILAAGGATSGNGILATAAGATDYAIQATGSGATDSGGFQGTATTAGEGIEGIGAGNGCGLKLQGAGSGDGLCATGGATGHGFELIGGATTGDGLKATGTGAAGNGMMLTRGGISGHDMSFATPDVTIPVVTTVTNAPTDMALNSTVAKDATVAKEATINTKIPTALSFTGANVNAESKVTAAPTDMALNSTVAKDATVMKAASYTAPDNAGIAAIEAKTGNLPASPAATGDAMTLTAAYDAAKTAAAPGAAMTLTASYDSAKTAAQESTSTAIKAKTDLIPASGIAEQATSLAIKAKTDNLPASPASVGDVSAVGVSVAAIPTNPVLTTDARIARLDATVSSRLASASYTAPDNAGIAAVKAKTDNLPADPASESVILSAVTELGDVAIYSYDAFVDQLVTLPAVHSTQMLNQGVPWDPAEVIGVGVYPTFADAVAGTNPIEEIAPEDVTRAGVGHYTFTVAAIATASVYFKAFIFKAVTGGAEIRRVTSWYVRKTSTGTPPGPHDVATVTINTFDISGVALAGEVFTVELITGASEYVKDLVSQSAKTFTANNSGIVSMLLTETDSMLLLNGQQPYYKVSAGSFTWSYGFRVPVGSGSVNLFDLPRL